MDSGKEQNFWPGFVDALSNVVLVMIFVVVVFVITLFYYSTKLAQMNAGAQIAEVAEPKRGAAEFDSVSPGESAAVAAGNPEREKDVERLKRELATLKSKLAAATLLSDPGSMRSSAAPSSPHAIQVRTEPSPGDEIAPGLRINANEKAVVLNFDADSVRLSEDGVKALDKALGEWIKLAKAGRGKIVVVGAASSIDYSDSRRRAYYRTVAVRNYLLEAGVDKDGVLSRISSADSSDENASRVIVQYLAGGK